jgi:transposase InsO family protein
LKRFIEIVGVVIGIPKPITVNRILERIQIDFTSFEYADPDTGDRHILTIIDCFSKFAWAKCFPTEVEPIARYIFELFLNELQYLGLFNTKQKNSHPRHPKTNGQIERFNGTLKRKLRENIKKVPNAPWEHLVPIVVAEYNNTYHSTIGRKPVEVFRPYNGNGDTGANLEELKAFAENLFAQTRERNQKKANATIKRHEAKYKLRVYVQTTTTQSSMLLGPRSANRMTLMEI